MSESAPLETIPRHWQDYKHDSKASMMDHMAVSWLRQRGMDPEIRAMFADQLFLSDAARTALQMIVLYRLDGADHHRNHMAIYDYTAADLEAAFEVALKMETEAVILKQLMYMGCITREELVASGRGLLGLPQE